MLLLERLETYTPELGRAVGRVQTDNPFIHLDGRLDPACFVEYLAQVAAAHEGFKRRLENAGPAGGFLVGVRDFTIEGPAGVGEQVEVVARRGLKFENFQVIEGAVEVEGKRVAAGELKILVSDEGLPAAAQTLEVENSIPVTRLSRRSLDRDGRRAEYLLDGSVAAFHGHFPGSPIFPAVAAIALAEDSVRAMEEGPSLLRAIKSAKFRAPVPPGSLVTTRCEPLASGRATSWRVRMLLGSTVAADMRLEFQERK
jgi:3-hydroxyacyl-[acyl-carrier-protein] dehydratase